MLSKNNESTCAHSFPFFQDFLEWIKDIHLHSSYKHKLTWSKVRTNPSFQASEKDFFEVITADFIHLCKELTVLWVCLASMGLNTSSLRGLGETGEEAGDPPHTRGMFWDWPVIHLVMLNSVVARQMAFLTTSSTTSISTRSEGSYKTQGVHTIQVPK